VIKDGELKGIASRPELAAAAAKRRIPKTSTGAIYRQ